MWITRTFSAVQGARSTNQDGNEVSTELYADCFIVQIRAFLWITRTFSACGAGRKQYDAALERLQAALVAPTMVLNAITLSAYKKWILLCLIRHGKVYQAPVHARFTL